MQYTIIIDETQRELILDALKATDPFESDYTESEAGHHLDLIDLFEKLPQVEAESPKVVHGFCL
jgi:hypothetical protein